MKSFPALDFWPVNPTVSAETQIAPDLPGDRYASITAYGARQPQNGGLTCDIDEGAVDQSEEFQSVGSIQDHLMITSRCCRPFLGTDEDVESLLFRVGECVRALKLNSGVTRGIFLVDTEKDNVASTQIHSEFPKVLCSSSSRAVSLRDPDLAGGPPREGRREQSGPSLPECERPPDGES